MRQVFYHLFQRQTAVPVLVATGEILLQAPRRDDVNTDINLIKR